MRTAVLLLLILAQDPEVSDQLRSDFRDFVSTMKSTGFFPAKRYDAVLKDLEGKITKETLHEITQLAYDHDGGDPWAIRLANDLGAEFLPEEVELEKITFKDGRVLMGTGGLLYRHFKMVSKKSLRGQRYLEPNLGVPGMGNLWISKANIKKHERVMAPLPKAFLQAAHSETIDKEGNLAIRGSWLRPGNIAKRETITLQAETVTNGGTLFVNAELGIQCLRRTHRYPDLAKPHELSEEFQKEMGWIVPPEPPRNELPAEFQKIISDLRAKAPNVAWPEPFNPVSTVSLEGLVDQDAEKSLLRIRIALTYGDDKPDLEPEKLIELEKQVLASLTDKSVDVKERDWEKVAAVLRHAPSMKPRPRSGKMMNAFVHFPKEYSPWRKWPVLLALHGQYSDPSYDFGLWKKIAEKAGMILVCPRYGSTNGFNHTPAEDEKVFGILRKLGLEYNIDPDRIYVQGLSMGGAMTWRLAVQFPGRWAALAPEIHGPTERSQNRKTMFPLLPNVKDVPLHFLESEFDGDSTINSREAAEQLKKWKAPFVFEEVKFFGHDRMGWRYPGLLRWFSTLQRTAHPTTVEHRSLHAFEGARAWIHITRSGGVAYGREDGAFSIRDVTGIQARVVDDEIRISTVTGKPKEVEIFWDPAIMPKKLTIVAEGKKKKWTVRPSVRTMLKRARETGDRSRIYPASIKIKM